MSLGTEVTARGRVVFERAPYAFFYRFIPGFDGLRVPSRFAMVVGIDSSGSRGS